MMENALCFTLKTLFVLKIFKFLSLIFGLVKKWLDKTDKGNFKIYDVSIWETNNFHTHIAQCLKK